MNNLLNQYLLTKKEIKALNREMKDELLKDTDFAEFNDEHKTTGEVLRSHKAKLVSESVFMGSIASKIEKKKAELKVLKASITDSLIVTEKESGEVVQYSFDFKL